MARGHILLFAYPVQSHINPSLQFAKCLVNIGVEVTFVTSLFAQRHISTSGEASTIEGLKFASFSDGYDEGYKVRDDASKFKTELRRRGSQSVRETIAASAKGGRPITCLVYTLVIPWAVEVARDFHLPSAMLWIQPATVLNIYYHYFHGYKEVVSDNINDPSWSIILPNLPLPLAGRDLPSFLLPQSLEIDTDRSILPGLKDLLDKLDGGANPKILVNTVEELEPEALKAIENYNLIPIGPLIPSAFVNGRDPTDTSFRSDFFSKSRDCVDWLNSKSGSSVIYVSFGSLLELPKRQMEEIACGLIECERPFLWVIRENSKECEGNDLVGYMEKLEEIGLIVPWCSQVEVLSHPSLGCFVTHCGWNSTLESLAHGVPTVAFPRQWDQLPNAKLIADVWETGVRVNVNEEGIVEGGEMKRCIEMVMGEEEFGRRKNAKKWMDVARKAVEDGGSSNINLKAFVKDIGL